MADEIITRLTAMGNDIQRDMLMRFFKTAPGEYGEGDRFLGIKVPQTRQVVKDVWQQSTLSDVKTLLMSEWHEVRLCGFLILVSKFQHLCSKRLVNDNDAITSRDDIIRLYLQYAGQANNWDLVDLSAPKIVGSWLLLPSHIEDKRGVIDELAYSDNLWKQRISMVCTWMTSREGDPSWCLRYAEIHLPHTHDLMHKAVGWMLREMGKNVSMDLLRNFLQQHYDKIHRTTLRYAIEKMSDKERMYWMKREE